MIDSVFCLHSAENESSTTSSAPQYLLSISALAEILYPGNESDEVLFLDSTWV